MQQLLAIALDNDILNEIFVMQGYCDIEWRLHSQMPL